MTPKESDKLIDDIATVVYASKRTIVVWSKGGTGERSLKQQRQALERLFFAAAGRKPTDDELKRMGADMISVG